MEGKGKREEGRKTEMKKWREVPGAVADPEGLKKKFFEAGRPPYLRVWMTPTPTPISEVWIRHWREREREGKRGKEREKKMEGRGGRKDATKEERN